MKKGAAYALCAEGQEPLVYAPCELGVTAHDAEDGSTIQKRVYLCPPDGCLVTGCSGHRVTVSLSFFFPFLLFGFLLFFSFDSESRGQVHA